MNGVTPALLLLLAFWGLIGHAFLCGATLARFWLILVPWQLFTPVWPFWVDSLLFLVVFTGLEMAYRAAVLSRRQPPAGSLPTPARSEEA